MWGTRVRTAVCALAALGLGLAWPSAAVAQSDDVLGAQAFDGSIDLRTSVVGGETGWLDGGFGKLRWGGDDGDTQARARIAAADLAWKPQFSFNFAGLVSVRHQAGQSNDADLNEAFRSFRSGPAPTRFSARAGVFWPPVSLEHGGSTWQVQDSITPSAVNSWIGEEVKVLAFEGKLEHRFAGQSLALTAKLARGESPAIEASLVKDLGTEIEQAIPRWIADVIGAEPEIAVSAELRRTISYLEQLAPSFSLRGGTREIMRGIIARGLKLR